MTENYARSVLRLIAIATIMYGLIMVVYTIFAFLGTATAMANVAPRVQVQMSGTVSGFSLLALVSHLAVSGIGFGLFAASKTLAAKVVE